ncbi:MAG: nitroreductase family protein [Nitrospirae bacterium]|nr:nitroreductase family protein [Nitrospirota bacterium]
MKRPAATDHPVHSLLRERWSPRAFSGRPVTDAELRAVLEAARWAASSYNDQPWAFVVTRRGEPAFQRLLDCLVPGNREWARHAPVLMLSVARAAFAHNGAPNRHAWHDVGQAAAQMTLQATALGLHIHQMAGFDPDAARAALGIPGGHQPVAAIALGEAGDPDGLPDSLRERERAPRQRVPQDAFVFNGRWGDPLP